MICPAPVLSKASGGESFSGAHVDRAALHGTEVELQRLTKLIQACSERLKKAAEDLEQEKQDRLSNFCLLQRQMSDCWSEYAAERGERKQLRSELAALRLE